MYLQQLLTAMSNELLKRVILLLMLLFGIALNAPLAFSMIISFCACVAFVIAFTLGNDKMIADIMNDEEPTEDILKQYSGLLYVTFGLFVCLTINIYSVLEKI